MTTEQCLDADDASIREVHLGLIVEKELLALHRAAQLREGARQQTRDDGEMLNLVARNRGHRSIPSCWYHRLPMSSQTAPAPAPSAWQRSTRVASPVEAAFICAARGSKKPAADGAITGFRRPDQVEPILAAADLELSSSSGGFDIDRADGSVTATTASGAIRIGRMTHGQAKLMNGSGNIEVGISDGTAASIDVSSERGVVRNSVASPSPESTGAPDATVTVHARTRHGDIIIHRAAS